MDTSSILDTAKFRRAVLDGIASISGGGGGTSTEQLAALQAIDAKTPALGQAPMASSQPVAIASDQIVPVSISTGQFSSLASSALQSQQLSALDSLNSKTPSLGQSTMASSQPVAIASDQVVPTNVKLVKRDGATVDMPGTEGGSVSVGNFLQKFRDGFVTAQPDTTVWNQAWINQGFGSVSAGGNSSGSAYMRISMCPITPGMEYTIWTKRSFAFPFRMGYGLSISQRIVGQEIEVSAVAVDGTGAVEVITPSQQREVAILGTVTIASNVATVNFAAPHGFNGGDRAILIGNADPRLNVGPVVVTVVTANQITVPCTLANGTYTAGGVVKVADPISFAKNGIGMVYENATATNASFVARRNGAKFRTTNSTVSTTAAVQSNANPYTDAFIAAGDMEIVSNMEEVIFVGRPNDALTAPTGSGRYSQSIPDEELDYAVRIRVKNLDNLTVPIVKIVSITKTGTTTANVVCSGNHGLTTSDFVQIYGVRDQTNFPNLTAQTAVSAIVSPTEFQVVIGATTTGSSAGGAVWKVQGSVLAPGVIAQAVQSISKVGNTTMVLVGSANWSGILPGETVHLYGCDANGVGFYDKAFKVLRTSTTTLELEDGYGEDFAAINCGGAIIKRTDIRLHYERMAAYTRHAVEIAGARGGIDAARAQAVTGAVTVSGSLTTVSTVTTVTTVTTVASVTSANLGIPLTVADVASAALTTTTTTAAFTPASGVGYTVNVPVTAMTGTNPTLDFTVEESDDAGTNWYKVYDFPRIIATGMYRSPLLKLRGNRVRYVQTVGGSSPSFTRAVNRLQANTINQQTVQLVDRTIVPNTLNSTSATLLIEGCVDFNFQIRCTAQTTAATIDLQLSDNGTDWFNVSGATLTTVVGLARVAITNLQAKFARAIVTAAGTGITLGELSLKGAGK